MGSPAIYAGSRTKLLTSKGLLLKSGMPIDYNGVKNYITRGSFETADTTGWSLKRTTLTNLIPDQVAASWTTPSVLTLSATQTGALTQSGYTMSLAASGATTAGDMLVTDQYALDLEDQAKTLSFKFSYQAYANGANLNFSGTSTNTFHVYIYDSTNDVWIQPTGCYTMVQGSGVGIGYGTFQTPSNMASFRLAFVSANASAGAFTLYLDNISVGPQYTNLGVPVTDWVSYTPTWTATTTNPSIGNGTITGEWRRVGDSMEIRIRVISGTSTTYGSGYYKFGLPSGYTILSKGADTSFGVAYALNIAGGSDYVGMPGEVSGVSTTTQVGVRPGSSLFTAWSNTVPATPSASTADQKYTLDFKVPIVGWSSNTVMSSDAATNVVAASYYGANDTSVAASSEETLKYKNKRVDTLGAYDTSTGLYTIKVPGVYKISAQASVTDGAGAVARSISIIKNTTNISRSGVHNGTSGVTNYHSTSAQDSFVAGDTIKINYSNGYSGGAATISDSYATYLLIERISGPTQIAASEVVAFQAYGVPTSAAFDGSVAVKWSAATYDTHGCYSPSTGKYSINISGFYRVSAQLGIQATTSSNGNVNVAVFKNTTTTIQGIVRIPTAATLNYFPATSGTIYCKAGDTIEIRANSFGVTSPSIVGSAAENFFIIERLGGVA